MIDTPQVVHTEALLRAYIPLVVPTSEIRTVMGPALAELRAAVAAQGIEVTGPWFTHHLRRPAETFDFEISVPVARPVVATGRVVPGGWPAMRLLRTVHRGGYDQLVAAWAEFMAWIETSGHRISPDIWERYLVGPESGPDPAQWRTELNRPLAD